VGPENELPAEPPVVLVELRELLERARKGDRDVLPLLREVLDDRPELWRHVGDLARHAQQAWINLTAGKDLYLAESLERRTEELKRELAGANATPLEQLLVDRVAAAWLQMEHASLSIVASAEGGPRLVEFHDRRQDRAHRRYMLALGALATVRKLLPSTQAESSPSAIAAELPTLRAYSNA